MEKNLQALYLVNKKAHQLKKSSKRTSEKYFDLKKQAILRLWLEGHLQIAEIHEPDLVWFESVNYNGKYNFHQKDEYEIMQSFGKPKKWTRDTDSKRPDKEKSNLFWGEDLVEPDYNAAKEVIEVFTNGFNFNKEKEKLRQIVRDDVCSYLERVHKDKIESSAITLQDLRVSIFNFPLEGNFLNFIEVFFPNKNNIINPPVILNELEIDLPKITGNQIIWEKKGSL